MALKRSTGAIPEGSVILSEGDAVHYQWKIVSSWQPASDVWPLKHGIPIAALSSSLTAMYINSQYRKMLKLGSHGRIVSYLPTVVIPAIATSIYHQQSILSDILIMKSECPVCVQIRSAATQAFFGGIYPTLLASFAGFMLATRHYTYDVPHITQYPMQTFKLWYKLFRRIQGFLVGAVCGQAVLGSVLTFLQMKSIIKVNEKIIAEEKSGAPFGQKDKKL